MYKITRTFAAFLCVSNMRAFSQTHNSMYQCWTTDFTWFPAQLADTTHNFFSYPRGVVIWQYSKSTSGSIRFVDGSKWLGIELDWWNSQHTELWALPTVPQNFITLPQQTADITASNQQNPGECVNWQYKNCTLRNFSETCSESLHFPHKSTSTCPLHTVEISSKSLQEWPTQHIYKLTRGARCERVSIWQYKKFFSNFKSP